MADVAKLKSEENQDKENIDESGDSEVEENVKDKKNNVDKNKKKNAAPAPAAKIKPPAKKRVKAEQAEESKKEKDGKKKKIAVKDKEEDDEEEEEDDDEDEDDAEEGDDEGSEGEENGVPEKVPLLDQPLEISGSRERKQVERFIHKEDLKSDADKKVEIPNGKGKPLGEIPRIMFQINKLKADNLKSLHKVLFNRVGQAQTIKKNIGQFKGFEFEKDSADQKKKLSVLTKLKNADLKTLCTILDLQKSGKHAELAEKILDFLLKPVDSGKEPPDPRPKRKGISSKSYKEPKADGDEQSKKGKSKQHLPTKKKNKESSEEDEQDEDSDEKKTEDEEENEIAGPEKDKPKKGPTKRPPAKKTASNSASGAKKRTAASGTGGGNKKGKEKSDSETEHNSEVEDSEKEAPAKKSKSPPTDDEIKSYVKSVLEGANLEEITMKTVCKKVYEHYPDFDLGYKKEFIKNTVKSLIAS